MTVLKTEGLTYQYSPGTPFEKTAVDHVNLEIEQGAFVGVIGHTGSGKSTLMQHFNGLLRPTSGTVLLNGTDIWANKSNIRQVRFQVGLVFQYPEYQLFEETVYRDIAFGPKNMGLTEAEIRDRVLEAAALVGLPEVSFCTFRGTETTCCNCRCNGTASFCFNFGRANSRFGSTGQGIHFKGNSCVPPNNGKYGSAGFSQHGRCGTLCGKDPGHESKQAVLL